MSTDYGPYCVDCKTGFTVENERSPETVNELIAAMKGIAPALARMPDGYGVSRGWGSGSLDVGWFAVHDSHNVVVWDEYGGIYPSCMARVDCGECKTWYYCHRKKDHSGLHSRTADDRATTSALPPVKP